MTKLTKTQTIQTAHTGSPTEEPIPEVATEAEPAPKPRTPREGTKQAKLIAKLRARDGATIEEITAETGWQSHTVRGAMAGSLKKKLRLEVTFGLLPVSWTGS